MVEGTSVDYDFKWIRPNMSLYHIDKNCSFPITLLNSGNLTDDFNKYAEDFFNAAESVIHYLGEDAAENGDIAKLDLWYFAMVYLYRQMQANQSVIVTSSRFTKDARAFAEERQNLMALWDIDDLLKLTMN